MYERFTDRARKVMQLANQEAQRFNHEYIGTEHILLGLVKEGSGVAANVLNIAFGVIAVVDDCRAVRSGAGAAPRALSADCTVLAFEHIRASEARRLKTLAVVDHFSIQRLHGE